MVQQTAAAVWYDRLSTRQQARVIAWLARNPPPATWRAVPLEWAWCEMTWFEVWGWF
jgi:hypothetical protein